MTTSRRYTLFAEIRAAEDLDLHPAEIRDFMLACIPRGHRQQFGGVDWEGVELVGRRCTKKIARIYEITQREAKEAIKGCYLAALDLADESEDTEEEEEEED